MTQLPEAPKGYWTCFWCWIFGNFSHARAFRPDSEAPVIDSDGDKVCQRCVATYRRERAKAEEGK